MPSILGANTLSSGFNIANGCLFFNNTKMNRTNASTSTNRQKGAFSTWIKKHVTSGTPGGLITGYVDANNYSVIYFDSDHRLNYLETQSGSTAVYVRTTQLFKDPAAWMHVALLIDSTQSTAANRYKFYVNGSHITDLSASTYGDQNLTLKIFAESTVLNLGEDTTGAPHYLHGTLCETLLVDGTTVAISDLGEFDEDSPTIWKPIDISTISVGTNGFRLDYEDSSNLGNDATGGTDLSESNIVAIDQKTDTCTNSFATMNPLDNFYQGATFSEGNCRVVTGSSPVTWNTSTFGLNSGKWYMEATIIDGGSGGSTLIGIADRPTVSASQELGGLATTYAYLSSGNFRTGDSNTSNSVSATDGDIIGVALDLDSGQNTISYYKNNTLIVAAQNITAPVSGNYFIASGVWLDNDTGTTDHNFGNPVVAHSSAASDANGYGSFEFAPPSGYYAICTKNIAQYG